MVALALLPVLLVAGAELIITVPAGPSQMLGSPRSTVGGSAVDGLDGHPGKEMGRQRDRSAATSGPTRSPVSGTAPPPYDVAPGLFAQGKTDLGLQRPAAIENATIFSADPGGDRFANGTVLIGFKGRLFAQWQSSARDEDSADTSLAYSISHDGVTWGSRRLLHPRGDAPEMRSNGGWWTDGQTLVAYVNVWPNGFQSGDGGYTEYITSVDGENWTAPRPVLGRDGRPVEGIIEQDPHRLSDGRIVTAFHTRPGMIVAPYYTDDPLGVHGWVRGRMPNLPHDGRVSRELEPSLFTRGKCIVMVFRDQQSSFRQLASESCDRGEVWSVPVVTAMPDARSKQSAGNLPDGTAYLVNVPNGGRERIPLALTLSGDGRCFNRALLLRGEADLQPLRYPGRYKRAGYHYPKSTVWKDHLYVGYTTNKEDVQLTRVPLAALASPSQIRPCK